MNKRQSIIYIYIWIIVLFFRVFRSLKPTFIEKRLFNTVVNNGKMKWTIRFWTLIFGFFFFFFDGWMTFSPLQVLYSPPKKKHPSKWHLLIPVVVLHVTYLSTRSGFKRFCCGKPSGIINFILCWRGEVNMLYIQAVRLPRLCVQRTMQILN